MSCCQAARAMSSAEASMLVAISASLSWVTALSASVPSPSLRVVAKFSASSSARRAKPSAAAPTVTRNRFSVCIATLKPSPGSPSSSASDAVELEASQRVRRDDLDPLRDREPGSSPRTMKAEMPRAPSSPSRCARTRSARRRWCRSRCSFLAVELPNRRHRVPARMAMLAASLSRFRLGQGEGGDRLAGWRPWAAIRPSAHRFRTG